MTFNHVIFSYWAPEPPRPVLLCSGMISNTPEERCFKSTPLIPSWVGVGSKLLEVNSPETWLKCKTTPSGRSFLMLLPQEACIHARAAIVWKANHVFFFFFFRFSSSSEPFFWLWANGFAPRQIKVGTPFSLHSLLGFALKRTEKTWPAYYWDCRA